MIMIQMTLVFDHECIFNQVVMDLINASLKMEDNDQALILFHSPPSFVDIMLYDRITVTLEDFKVALNVKGLMKNVTDCRGEMPMAVWSRGTSRR